VKLRTLSQPIPNSRADEHQLGGSAPAIERLTAVDGRTTRLSGSLKMVAKERSAAAFNPLNRVSPLMCIGCGAVLITAGAILHWLEAGQAFAFSSPSHAAPCRRRSLPNNGGPKGGRRGSCGPKAGPSARQRRPRNSSGWRSRRQRQKRLGVRCSRTALPRPRRGLNERNWRAGALAVDEAHSAAVDAEEAWKRFYKPSATCRDAAASATVECVNEYIKAAGV